VTTAGTELVALEWERIQLRIRLRSEPPNDPGRFRLVAAEATGSGDAMPPTHASADGDGTELRFNVTLGPGQMPLRRGTWFLAGEHGPIRFARHPLIGEDLHRLFGYRSGRYGVVPGIDAGGRLALEITHRGRRRRRRPAAALRRWWRRNVRHRLFDAMVIAFRQGARHDGTRVLLTSDSHTGLAGNLGDVHARLVERGLDQRLRIDMLFKPSVVERRRWLDRWRMPRLLARADIILLDDFQPAIYRLPPDPDVRIIQLWHASGAFKTVGYSRVGKPGGPSPFSRRHKNYTHAIVSGRHDVPFYAEAFGIPEERVIPTGIPRMDRFYDPALRATALARVAELFPSTAGRRVILFAPTFRGSGPRHATYAFELLDLVALHETAVARDAVVLIKMHPFIRERVSIPDALRDRIIDATDVPMDVNDLLFDVDLLVTDYSSIVFEFATQLRPMLFFAYDLDEYIATRDFYVPFEAFVPGRIVRTFSELVAAIRDEDYEAHKVEPFARRHFDHLDGGATDRVIDQLILNR